MAKKDKLMEAKRGMLEHLKKMMSDDMHEGLKEGMKKVTVMSDSEEGLEEGLEKAKEIMEKRKDEYACGGAKKMKDGGIKPMESSKSLGEGKAYYDNPKRDYLEKLRKKQKA